MVMDQSRKGIDPTTLDDDEVRREMLQLHQTRHETVLHGSDDALETRTRRMLELENEYLRRFPQDAAPDRARTRAGSRRAAHQD